MTLRRRQFLRLAGAAAALPFAPYVARAQGWPNKTIRLIAPFSAGSTVDVVGRLLTEPLSQQLGQTMVLENRVGAGGMTGATMVARADPDGYTILINSSAHSAIPAIYPNVPYDTGARFRGGGVARQLAECHRGFAGQGHQDAERAGRRRQVASRAA